MSALKIFIEIILFLGFLIGIAFVTKFDFSQISGNFDTFVEEQSSHIIWTLVTVILSTTFLGILKALLFRKRKIVLILNAKIQYQKFY